MIFKGQMPFLSEDQQRQITEGKILIRSLIVCIDAACRPRRSESWDEQFLRGAQLQRDRVPHDVLRLGAVQLRT